MKLIVAIVRPFLLEKLVVSLENIENFPGITASDVEGFGRSPRHTRTDLLNPFRAAKRIEIAAPDDMVDQILDTIRGDAHTGKLGDGIIFVLPVESFVVI